MSVITAKFDWDHLEVNVASFIVAVVEIIIQLV